MSLLNFICLPSVCQNHKNVLITENTELILNKLFDYYINKRFSLVKAVFVNSLELGGVSAAPRCTSERRLRLVEQLTKKKKFSTQKHMMFNSIPAVKSIRVE